MESCLQLPIILLYFYAMTEIQKRIFDFADLEYRNFHSVLIPTVPKEKIIGVRVPVLRKMASALYKNEPVATAAFLDSLPHRFYEENNLHAFLISHIPCFRECVSRTEAFLPFIDNWATCDSFRPKVFSANRPLLLPLAEKWISSHYPYTIRFGIGCYMKYFLDNDFREDFLDKIASIHSDEYYVNMMRAWYFATALSKRFEQVFRFISHGHLDDFTHNKAIQKAIESRLISHEQKTLLRSLKRKT